MLVVRKEDWSKKLNADKTKYVFVSCEKNAGMKHNNKNVAKVKYFGTALTNHIAFKKFREA